MKVLITQANRSEDIELLKNQLMKYDCDLVLFPEGFSMLFDYLDSYIK